MALINYPPVSENNLVVTILSKNSLYKCDVYTNTATILKAGNVNCLYEYQGDLKVAFNSTNDRDRFYANFGEYYGVKVITNDGINYFFEKK